MLQGIGSAPPVTTYKRHKTRATPPKQRKGERVSDVSDESWTKPIESIMTSVGQSDTGGVGALLAYFFRCNRHSAVIQSGGTMSYSGQNTTLLRRAQQQGVTGLMQQVHAMQNSNELLRNHGNGLGWNAWNCCLSKLQSVRISVSRLHLLLPKKRLTVSYGHKTQVENGECSMTRNILGTQDAPTDHDRC